MLTNNDKTLIVASLLDRHTQLSEIFDKNVAPGNCSPGTAELIRKELVSIRETLLKLGESEIQRFFKGTRDYGV